MSPVTAYRLARSAQSSVARVTTPTMSTPPMLALRSPGGVSASLDLGTSTMSFLFSHSITGRPRNRVRISPVAIAPADRTVM